MAYRSLPGTAARGPRSPIRPKAGRSPLVGAAAAMKSGPEEDHGGWYITGGIVSNMSGPPDPVAAVREWQRWGSCRNADASMFFAPDRTPRRPQRRREHGARAVCANCPVRPQCAAQALATREPYGIWGGFTESERRRLLAMGWEDLVDHRRRWVDIAGLVARLRSPSAATPAPVAERAVTPADGVSHQGRG
jgi:WhiB family transcriptional regulator, redox-sensing transcriptional regulator